MLLVLALNKPLFLFMLSFGCLSAVNLQDNVNVFLKACGKLGLNVSQLFHPGDLQDLSSRATLRYIEFHVMSATA